jgi:hypothetical protein
MGRVLALSILVAIGCGKKKEEGAAVAPPATAAADDAGRAAAAKSVTDAAPAAVAKAAEPAEVTEVELEAMEPIESIAAHCEGEGCEPKRKPVGKLAAPAPPFQAVTILNRGPDAMEDTGYLFVQTAKGWFVREFLWSVEEGELQHRVVKVEVTDYVPGGAPELVIALDRRLLDGDEGPVMHLIQDVLIVCAVDAASAPSCLDPAEPIVLSSRADDASWRLEVTARPDGTLDRKAVDGTPPPEAVGPFRLAPP